MSELGRRLLLLSIVVVSALLLWRWSVRALREWLLLNTGLGWDSEPVALLITGLVTVFFATLALTVLRVIR